jgi:hypothetical protein
VWRHPPQRETAPMDHCDECGFTYPDHGPLSLSTEIRDLGVRDAAVLNDPAVDETRLNARSSPDVWSPVEYGCHVRDVLLAQRERLLLALVEDEPTFAPIYRNQRVDLVRYRGEAPGQVVARSGSRRTSSPGCSMGRGSMGPDMHLQLSRTVEAHGAVASPAHPTRGRAPPSRYRAGGHGC